MLWAEGKIKDSYLVEKESIEFRRANAFDNLEEIAELIYYTDPYIYSFWFQNNVEEAKNTLKSLIKEEGFVFNYDNLYIAYDKTTGHIIGVICALDNSINFDYNYENLEKVNHNYSFTINRYIKPVIEEVKHNDFLYISNVCIKDVYRGKKIGSHLLGYFISQMEKKGFNEFALDCLLHNLRAKNLYHSFGFKEMKEIVGFDGTDTSKVEIVSFLRKKGDYFPEEFGA